MKNKTENILIIIVAFIFLLVVFINTYFGLKSYQVNYNYLISNIISNLKEEYPTLDEDKVIEILNEKTVEKNSMLTSYGIHLETDSVSQSNKQILFQMMFMNGIFLLLFVLALLFIFNASAHKKNKQIKKLTNYVEEINRKNYKLDLLSNEEDEISILQNEIYKTMVMLRETADQSLQDKVSLKNSLSDISHQLKTPLTSINIMLDNIIDDALMEASVRNEFIIDIKREILNINFLIQSILKLSSIDANAIKFTKEYVKLSKIIDESIKNVSVICDLKNINIHVEGNKNIKVNCDFKWQVEAITNIIKNAIEHSHENSTVDIKYEQNKVYTTVTITDYGIGIDAKVLPNIFKRFYRDPTSDTQGYGIGLSLAKSIIEAQNGSINVSSVLDQYTIFTIKYFN